MLRKPGSANPPQPTETPEPAQAADSPQAPTETEQAAELRARAAQLRRGALEARTAAGEAFTAAQAEAARTVAEARQAVTDAGTGCRRADYDAKQFEERAQMLTDATMFSERLRAAEEEVVDLVAEIGEISGHIASHNQQLADLGEQREDTTAALAAARDAGNVQAVTDHRQRMASIDEVVTAVTSKRDAAQAALNSIGDPDGRGTLAAALTRAQSAAAERRRILNLLDPTRPEAKLDALQEQLLLAIAAQTPSPPTRPSVQTVTRPDGSAVHAVHVPRPRN